MPWPQDTCITWLRIQTYRKLLYGPECLCVFTRESCQSFYRNTPNTTSLHPHLRLFRKENVRDQSRYSMVLLTVAKQNKDVIQKRGRKQARVRHKQHNLGPARWKTWLAEWDENQRNNQWLKRLGNDRHKDTQRVYSIMNKETWGLINTQTKHRRGESKDDTLVRHTMAWQGRRQEPKQTLGNVNKSIMRKCVPWCSELLFAQRGVKGKYVAEKHLAKIGTMN